MRASVFAWSFWVVLLVSPDNAQSILHLHHINFTNGGRTMKFSATLSYREMRTHRTLSRTLIALDFLLHDYTKYEQKMAWKKQDLPN